ncbi:hypothetical protein [Priestia aryabhattai]|uniref:hypothetical protein n=1 Tax=Priestia aryabhattai TaxID=412384 RepID=UPI003D2A90B4
MHENNRSNNYNIKKHSNSHGLKRGLGTDMQKYNDEMKKSLDKLYEPYERGIFTFDEDAVIKAVLAGDTEVLDALPPHLKARIALRLEQLAEQEGNDQDE